MIFTHFHFHSNFWYAEYTHAQTIHQFVRLYRKIMDIFNDNPHATVGWDMDVSLTLPSLKRFLPSFVDDMNRGIEARRQEIVIGTYANSLTTQMSRPEFDLQFDLSKAALVSTFGHVANCYFPQDGAWSPNLPRLLKEKGVDYTMTHQNVFNRFCKGQYTQKERFQPFLIEGHDGTTIPSMVFAFEGIISSSDHFANFNKLKERLSSDPALKDEDLLLINFFDTERVNPSKLQEWIVAQDKLGFKFMLPEEFLKRHPPKKGTTKARYFEDTDWHAPIEFHNEVPPDQALYTELERARKLIAEGEYWLGKARAAGIPCLDYYEGELLAAKKHAINCTSSDKSHWFSCDYKVKVGQQMVMNAREKADWVAGALAELVATKEGTKAPVSFYSYPEHDIKLLNLHTMPVPAAFPVHVAYPFILQANFHLFQDPGLYLDGRIIPVFHSDLPLPSEPGVNYIPEFIFQPGIVIKPGEMHALKFVKNKPTDGASKPRSACIEVTGDCEAKLQAGTLEVIVKRGALQSINDAKERVAASAGDASPLVDSYLKNTTSGFSFIGAADSGARVEIDAEEKSPFHAGIAFTVTKEPHLVESTRYRVYDGFPALEIDKVCVVQGKMAGDYVPFHVSPGFTPETVERELLGTDLVRKLPKNEDAFPRINEWAIISGEGKNLMIAADSQVHSVKFLPFNKDGTFDFGLMRGYPPYLPVNLIGGVYQYRALVMPCADRAAAKQLAKLYRYGPTSNWWL
ncbi:MAG: hypothetical protein Q6373_014445 [Candidatus Sigynarchaeota archaeon]